MDGGIKKGVIVVDLTEEMSLYKAGWKPQNIWDKGFVSCYQHHNIFPMRSWIRHSKLRRSSEKLTKFYFMADCQNDANPLKLVPNT